MSRLPPAGVAAGAVIGRPETPGRPSPRWAAMALPASSSFNWLWLGSPLEEDTTGPHQGGRESPEEGRGQSGESVAGKRESFSKCSGGLCEHRRSRALAGPRSCFRHKRSRFKHIQTPCGATDRTATCSGRRDSARGSRNRSEVFCGETGAEGAAREGLARSRTVLGPGGRACHLGPAAAVGEHVPPSCGLQRGPPAAEPRAALSTACSASSSRSLQVDFSLDSRGNRFLKGIEKNFKDKNSIADLADLAQW